MKADSILFAVLWALWSGCGTPSGTLREPRPPHASRPEPQQIEPFLAQLEERSYTAEELGIQVEGEPGSQTIRWKEIINPSSPVVLPLLPPQKLSIQPRIAASINGSPPTPISIDSGAGLNLLDASLGLRHGIKVVDLKTFSNVFEGLGGSETAYYAMIDRIVAGPLSIRNMFTILRIPPKEGTESLDNVLGLTSLAKFSYVTLDFPARQAIFALEGDYAPVRTVVAEAPILLHSLQLIVEVQINRSHAVNVLLDTGNDASLMLTESIVSALGLSDAAAAGKKGRFLGIGGEVETQSFPLESLSVGGVDFGATEATEVPNNFLPALGSGFLQQFRATIDFKARKLWLER